MTFYIIMGGILTFGTILAILDYLGQLQERKAREQRRG